MPNIKLQSSDGQIFEVDLKVACASTTINDMISTLQGGESDEEEIVPVPKVTGDVLKMIIAWAEYHKGGDDKDESTTKSKKEMDDWDKQFVEKMNNETLFEVVKAANYLDVKELLDLTCVAVSALLRSKSPMEIRGVFGLP